MKAAKGSDDEGLEVAFLFGGNVFVIFHFAVRGFLGVCMAVVFVALESSLSNGIHGGHIEK